MPDLSRFAALAVKSGVVPPVPPAVIDGGTAGRREIIELFQCNGFSVPPVPPVPSQNKVAPHESDLIDVFEERAAIMEYDGGMSRQDAESLAWTAVFGSRARTV